MLSLRRLPWLNLRGYPARTTALVLFSMLMAIAVFGGTLLIQGVRQGLDTTRSRLGADILVTPADAADEFDAQSVLVQANPGYFYMPVSTLDAVAKVPGVEAASPQLFLASARTSCCSGRYQIIAFDPDTDFVIQPWIADTLTGADLGALDLVVGSNVTAGGGDVFRLFDNDCRVVGRFSATGSTLDNAIYTDFDTAKVLIASSISKGLNKYGDVDTDEVISSVLVRVAADHDAEAVAADIADRVDGVSVATSAGMLAGIADSVREISRTVGVFAGVVWVIGLVMTVLLFGMLLNERRREFAALMVMGATRRTIVHIMVREAVAVNLAGGLLGVVVTGVLLGSFEGLVGQSLGVGLVRPGVGMLAMLAALSLVLALVAAAGSSWVAVRTVSRLDASLLLKESE
ncbi:ABC transporter permease [Actinomyces sp.]|uniref:ABC transporter permease n=1 Tax=Actinomyces sp. TaxID=29317 RepID=UPI0026DB4C44|nr:ABC transporter permease [Actinomyces sp.]MDO4901621.1 ABC transporter permease [Actinomyces sp.]